MPVIAQQPIDIQWVVILASSASIYTGKAAALIGATLLSGLTSNAPVQMAQIVEQVSASGGTGKAQVDLPGNGIPLYVVQLQTATTYYPLETARVQAYATSASNSNGQVYIAKVVEVVMSP